MNYISKTVSDIKRLKIQGASKVREKAVRALVKTSASSKAKTPGKFRKEFLSNSKKLFDARPTEPALRTALRIFKKSISDKKLSVEEMKLVIKKTDEYYETDRAKAMKKMAKYGAQLIKRNSCVLTLCHSHSAIDVLLKARKKLDRVYCCETRPLYQGRETAKELSAAGIHVTLLVDNAASTIMKDCDYFFTGADAFLGDGDVVNKIGTNQISTLCKRYEVPHYSVCSTHKFEPSSFFGKDEPIEQRNPHEVFTKKVPRLKVMNPAFDRTDSNLIEGIISEIGVFPSEVLASKLYDDLELDKHETDFLKL
jgi:eIF-2B alpha/beta/delta-like uncharacterized protein